MAIVFGFCLLWGCASPSARNATAMKGSAGVPGDNTGGQAASGTHSGQAADAARRDEPESSACDNKSIERVEEYWPSGNPKFFQEVVIGEEDKEIPHGLTTQFWPSGNKKLEMEYDCGVRNGPRVTWYDNGKLWSEGEFVDGKDHGRWIVWFPDETKSQEFSMVHGAWHGTHTMWGPGGHKRMEVDWVDGKRQGTLKLWDSEGQLFSADHYVEDIKQPTPLSYAEDGG